MKMKLSNTYRLKSDAAAVWADLMDYANIERYRQPADSKIQPTEVETPDASHYIIHYNSGVQFRGTILENIPEEKLVIESEVLSPDGKKSNHLRVEYLVTAIPEGGTQLTFRRVNEMSFSLWVFTKWFSKKEDLFLEAMKARLGEA